MTLNDSNLVLVKSPQHQEQGCCHRKKNILKTQLCDKWDLSSVNNSVHFTPLSYRLILVIVHNYYSIYCCEHSTKKNALISLARSIAPDTASSHSHLTVRHCVYNAIDNIEQYWRKNWIRASGSGQEWSAISSQLYTFVIALSTMNMNIKCQLLKIRQLCFNRFTQPFVSFGGVTLGRVQDETNDNRNDASALREHICKIKEECLCAG